MSRIAPFVFCLSALLALRCQAQGVVPATPAPPSINRRIEVLVRSQFPVPPDCEIEIGERTPSAMAGYDNLPITFVVGAKRVTSDFLISKDGRTLARLQKFDLDGNPALAIDVDKRPIRGEPSAPVEIVNFDDLECPFCAAMNVELAQQTLEHYKGLIKIVYKDYPIEEIHPWAMHAAVDANCLATQSTPAYWAYVDYVHANAQKITGEKPDAAHSFIMLDDVATLVGAQNAVDGPALSACIARQDHGVVERSLKTGEALLLDGTPQVFVAGERLPSGARPVDELWPAIDRALRAQGIQPPARKAPPSSDGPAKAVQPSSVKQPG